MAAWLGSFLHWWHRAGLHSSSDLICLEHPDENTYTLNAVLFSSPGTSERRRREMVCWRQALWRQAGAPASYSQDLWHIHSRLLGAFLLPHYILLFASISFSSWFEGCCLLCNSLDLSLCQVFQLCLVLCRGMLHCYFHFMSLRDLPVPYTA